MRESGNDIPDLHGQVALVTGANSGLGLETTRALAAQGAHVIMACRTLDKAHQAEAEIKQTVAGALVEVITLRHDLGRPRTSAGG